MSATAIYFIAGVDQDVGVFSIVFEDFNSFFATEETVPGSESFDSCNGVSFPQYAAGDRVSLQSWGYVRKILQNSGEMFGI